MKPVKSSNIHAIDYDPAARKLSVQFKDGDQPGNVYHYHDVPPETHSSFMDATDSHGKYFFANIKGKYKHEKGG